MKKETFESQTVPNKNIVEHLHELPPVTFLQKNSAVPLVEQIVANLRSKIDDKFLPSGAKIPSIRAFADEHGVSRFTVVEAYDRLVAAGYVESRRGAGFFVRTRHPLTTVKASSRLEEAAPQKFDIAWLVRNMFRQHPAQLMPGSGLLPANWMSEEIVSNSFRAVARDRASSFFQYGSPQGYLPLRQQLQLKLDDIEIAASPDQIVTTSGITQGLDLVARHFLAPGDVVFVDDPAWFLMFGSFAALGARVIGVPRTTDGPDISTLEHLAAEHRPKMYVVNSILHNPTSSTLSPAKAFQVLKVAEKYDFVVVEDDVYSDLHPGASYQPATRMAALDQLERVIYLGGFSKTLAANLRVGYIACAPEIARQLTDRKILSTLTTTEISERIVYKVLSEGHYRKHVERLRSKLDAVREKTLRTLEGFHLRVDFAPSAGMFLWVETGADSNLLAERAMRDGVLLAPGSLFSPTQLASSRMRVNVAAMSDPGVINCFNTLFS